MRRRHLLALLALPPAVWLIGRATRPPPAGENPLQRLLGGTDPATGFARALAPRPFVFPRDHAAHPGYRHEWWYFTGNLVSATGRPFGFQLTFFRFALTPEVLDSRSAWATRQTLLGHFALSDVEGGTFHHAERLARPVLGVAGTGEHPPRVWIRDWQAAHSGPPAQGWTLAAAHEGISLSLTLEPTRPYVAQGDRGYSRKGAGAGNASFYYAGTRLQAEGQLRLDQTPLPVRGHVWLDREWGTSVLDRGTRGWDWFGLHLSDGSDLMLYVLRADTGDATDFSAGSLVSAAGTAEPLAAGDFAVAVLAHWSSARDGRRYPARWQIDIPRCRLTLEIEPRLPDQEWTGFVRYWEGSVRARGTRHGHALSGEGYAELTGY